MNKLPPPLLPSFDAPIGHMAYLPPTVAAEDPRHVIHNHGRPMQQLAAPQHDAKQGPQSASATMASMRHFSIANMESFLPMQPVLDANGLVPPEAAYALANMATSGAEPSRSRHAPVCFVFSLPTRSHSCILCALVKHKWLSILSANTDMHCLYADGAS
jgi:hypothetical protein